MNRIKTYLNNLGKATRAVILALAVIFVSAGIAQATTTTINTSVTTTNLTASGTLGVTGLSTFAYASTTGALSVAGNFMVNGMATTTSAGALSLAGNLTVGAAATGGTITVSNGTTAATATSTITVGCVVTTATSTETPIKLMFNVEATSTTLSSKTVQGLVLWGYGSSCP
ncbi:MAG: hypothetical protein WCT41_03325 [Candidatus Paceibacterota bacterium]|jgi:hypothetical protein